MGPRAAAFVVDLKLNWRRTLVSAGLFFIAYLLGARVGIWAAAFLSEVNALLWIPAGLSMAVVYLGGYRFTIVIILASLVNVAVINDLPLTLAAGISLANALQAFVGAFVLRTFRYGMHESRVKDVGLILCVAFFASMIHPTMVLASQFFSGVEINYAARWVNFWIGNLFSIMVLTPLIISWRHTSTEDVRNMFRLNAGTIEFYLLTGVVVLSSYLVGWTTMDVVYGFPLAYLLLGALLWIALRFGVRHMLTALFLSVILTLTGVFFGAMTEEEALQPIGEIVLSMERGWVLFSVAFYIVAALFEERRRSRQELRKKIEELEHVLESISRSERAKTEFIAILAHELRNPLTPIVNYVELIKRSATTPQIASWIAGIETNMKSVVTLLNDILDVSRVTERKFKLNWSSIVLQEAIQNSVKMVEVFRMTNRVKLSITMPDMPMIVHGDRIRLEQVFVNVLNNAIKFSPEGSEVSVSARVDEEKIEVTVEDEGTGIEEAEVDKLFEPFTQLSTASAVSSGLGIGLFLAKNFVELHGGTISAKNHASGRGSIFTITLPASLIINAAAVLSPMSDEFSRTFNANGSKQCTQRVLVVDDKLDAATSLANLIESSGHQTDIANDGAAALKAVRTFEPDTIFLDIRMPDMNGYEVAARLRKEGVRAKIVALTGFGQQEDKQKAWESGFDEHLTKPIDIDRVLEIIHAPRQKRFRT